MLDILSFFDGAPAPNGPPFVTGASITTTRASTNVIDMLAAADAGAGEAGAELHIAVTQTFTGGTSLQIELQESIDNVTFVGLIDSPVMPVAGLVVGAPVMRIRLPNWGLNETSPGRYARLYYNVVGTFTAGMLIAYLAAAGDRGNFFAYPKGYSIDA